MVDLKEKKKAPQKAQEFFRRKKTIASSRLPDNKRNLVRKIYLKNKAEGLVS